MKNKIATLFLTFVLMATMLCGCAGGSTEQPNEPNRTGQTDAENGNREQTELDLGPTTGEISFYVAGGPMELALWDKLISEFEKQNEGITVKKIQFSNYDTVFSALQAGNAPDVIQVANNYLGNWAAAGAIKSLQPLIDQEQFDTSVYWNQIITMFSYDSETRSRGTGDLYALPKDYGVYGIYVNQSMLDNSVSAGYITEQEKQEILDRKNPMTFDRYLELAKKLTVKKNGEVKQFGTNSIMAESYLWSLGADLIKDGKYFNAEDPKVQQVYQYIANMVNPNHKDYCAPSPTDTSSQDDLSMFLTGKICMYWAGRWAAPSFDAANMKLAVIPVPVAEKGGTPYVPAVSAGYAISRNSKKMGMAWKFIKFMASETAYKTMNEMNYLVPGIQALGEDPVFTTPVASTSMTSEDLKVFIELAGNAKCAYGDYFLSNRWYDMFNQKITPLFDGSGQYKDAADCLLSIKEDIDAAIRSSAPQLFE